MVWSQDRIVHNNWVFFSNRYDNFKSQNNTTPPHASTYVASTISRPMTPTSTTPPRPPPTPSHSSAASVTSTKTPSSHNHYPTNTCSSIVTNVQTIASEAGDCNCPDNGPSRLRKQQQPLPLSSASPSVSVNTNTSSQPQTPPQPPCNRDVVPVIPHPHKNGVRDKHITNKTMNSNNNVSLSSSHRSSLDDAHKSSVVNNNTNNKVATISSSVLASNSLSNTILSCLNSSNSNSVGIKRQENSALIGVSGESLLSFQEPFAQFL